MRRKYKFYLAFENSLCQEYITEKFWKALTDGLVRKAYLICEWQTNKSQRTITILRFT